MESPALRIDPLRGKPRISVSALIPLYAVCSLLIRHPKRGTETSWKISGVPNKVRKGMPGSRQAELEAHTGSVLGLFSV